MRPFTALLTATVLAACGHQAAGPGGRDELRVISWHLLSTAGRQVRIQYSFGGCDHDPVVRSRESADRVVITVRVHHPHPHDDLCPAVIHLGPARVTLAAPLGQRQLVDGSTGRPPAHGQILFHTPRAGHGSH